MNILRSDTSDLLSNLSNEEALLDSLDKDINKDEVILLFWEVDSYAVILGRGCNQEDDIHIDVSLADSIPIIKRVSGGGTVLLGPGVLCYSIFIPYSRSNQLLNINSSYKYIIEKICTPFNRNGLPLAHMPISDIALNEMKVSGSAQARRRRYILHHGTFLYSFKIPLISRYLKTPKKVPEYRGSREHQDFVINIPLGKSRLEDLLIEGAMQL